MSVLRGCEIVGIALRRQVSCLSLNTSGRPLTVLVECRVAHGVDAATPWVSLESTQ
jgi:hypothetical protein